MPARAGSDARRPSALGGPSAPAPGTAHICRPSRTRTRSRHPFLSVDCFLPLPPLRPPPALHRAQGGGVGVQRPGRPGRAVQLRRIPKVSRPPAPSFTRRLPAAVSPQPARPRRRQARCAGRAGGQCGACGDTALKAAWGAARAAEVEVSPGPLRRPLGNRVVFLPPHGNVRQSAVEPLSGSFPPSALELETPQGARRTLHLRPVLSPFPPPPPASIWCRCREPAGHSRAVAAGCGRGRRLVGESFPSSGFC